MQKASTFRLQGALSILCSGCRNNTFSGIQYQDDWAIFGWDLFNEPRCPASQTGTPCTSTLTDWGNMMFAYAKSLNKNQLVRLHEYTAGGALKRLRFRDAAAIALVRLDTRKQCLPTHLHCLQFTYGHEGFFAEGVPANASWWQSIMNTWYAAGYMFQPTTCKAATSCCWLADCCNTSCRQ